MSKAIITVTIDVHGDPADIVQATHDFKDAAADHFNTKMYPGMKLLMVQTAVKNYYDD